MLRMEVRSDDVLTESQLVGVVDKDGDEGNYYFLVITFGEMFFLYMLKLQSSETPTFRAVIDKSLP